MSTKKLQILDYNVKQAQNADTLDGKHADEFVTPQQLQDAINGIGGTGTGGSADHTLSDATGYTDEKISEWIGDTKVSEQIADAVNPIIQSNTVLNGEIVTIQSDIDSIEEDIDSIMQDINTFNEFENTLHDKVDKVDGMGLSENNFSDYYKTLLDDNMESIKEFKETVTTNNIRQGGFEWAFRSNKHYSLMWKGVDG